VYAAAMPVTPMSTTAPASSSVYSMARLNNSGASRLVETPPIAPPSETNK
jgi:hypothetical protein